MKREGIKLEGYKGKWYVIDETDYEGQTVYLLEHETHGDDWYAIIVDGDCRVIRDDVYNGFSDLEDI